MLKSYFDKSCVLQKFGYQQELKRFLNFWDLLIFGIIFMVPIAPFGIYGYVAKVSNGMVALAYLIGMIGMLFTALSYAELSKEFPIAGSVYSYAQRGISEHMGFFAGWLILLDYILVPALLYLVSATALASMLPQIPNFFWLIAFICINTVINIRGIEITAKTNKIIVILEVIVFLCFVFVAIIAIRNNINNAKFSIEPFFNSSNFDVSLVMSAASIAVLSFLGFDAISTLTEEVKGNRTVVGKAIIFSIIIVGFMFVIQTWIAGMVFPNYTAFNKVESAFYEIAGIAGGDLLRSITIIATALAWGIANALVAQVAISRILFSMARDKKLPGILAKVHPTYKTPYTSILLVSFISLVIILLPIKIEYLASLVNFGALSSFMLIHITVINYFLLRMKSKHYVKHLILPVVGLLITGYVWISLGPLAKKIGFIWICIGILYMVTMKLLNKDSFIRDNFS